MSQSFGTGKNKSLKNNSVTEENLLCAFIMFMLPLIAASILQQSYAIADGLILGNAINQSALGAVSSVSPVLDLCTLVQIGLAGGCSIMVSHLFGAEKYGEVNRLISDIMKITVIISLLIAAAAFLASKLILEMIHTPSSLISGASLYLRITFIGVPFMALYTLQAGILRGMGDSNRPLGGIAVSSIVNIGLDLIFVVVFKFGIAGLAYGSTYWYKVRAFRRVDGATYYSSWSNIRSYSLVPGKPTLSSVKNKKNKTAVIKWKKVSGASGYEIYRSTKKSSGYKKVATIKKGSTVTYTNKKLKKGKTYYYKVRSYKTVNKKKGYSAYSAVRSVKIKK